MVCLLLGMHASHAEAQASGYAEVQESGAAGIRIYVDRKERKLWVIEKGKEVAFSSPVGIGRGGLKQKHSME